MKETIRKASTETDESGLLRKAQACFAAGRYQEAADLFKELLNQADKVDYRRQLSQCYLQWAQCMAAKGQVKEAASLWESYANWAELPLVAQDSYVLWLLAAKEYTKVHAALEGLLAKQLDQDYPELAVLLGFLLVSGRPELAQHLPQDSTLFRHWQLVQDALAAYRSADAGRCDQALNKLPFRSAFRDFRLLLKSQLLAAASPAQAKTLFSKIPESSPYRSTANAGLAYLQTGAEFVASISQLESAQRRTIAQARALSANQLELVEAVSGQGGWQANKVRFNLTLQYRSLFAEEAARAFCLGMLEHYPEGYRDYLNYFGVKEAFEENRIQALLCEKSKNSYDAQLYWRRCIAILKENAPEDNKKIAMILRHMAGHVSREEAVELLIESLDYQPEHRDSYLKILSFYGQDRPNPSKYEQWLERSRNRFPDDAGILLNAAESAVKRKAFKQAFDYAQALLEIEPSNKLAKQLIFGEHIAQARQFIRNSKFELAEKEIQSAEQGELEKDSLGQVRLLRGFYVWLVHDQQQGLKLIADALEKLNDDPVTMQFQVLMEAALVNQPCPVSLSTHAHLLSRRQLHRLIGLIEHYDQQIANRKLLLNALDEIKVPVENSIARHVDDEALLLCWCRALQNIGHFELLRHCTVLASEKWQKPIWLYYQTLVECQGDAGRLDHVTLFKLQAALASAREAGDSQAVLLIGRLIEQNRIASDPFAYGDDIAEIDDELQADDLYEALFSHLPVNVMEKLEQKVQDIMLDTDPERFAEQAIQQYGKDADPHGLAVLFDNPDFFASVALLAAADALSIDVGVGIEDVVARFEQTLP